MSAISDQPDPVTRLPRKRQLMLVGCAAITLAVVVVLANAFHAQAPEPAEARGTPGVFVATPGQYAGFTIATVGAPVAAGAGGRLVHATGIITANEDRSTPVLPPLTGQITQVFVQPGAHVVQGQPLAVIRSTERVQARDALVTAAAQRDMARSQLDIAQANARRQELVYRNGGGAQRDYQQAQNDLVTAQAAMKTAQAAYVAAQDQLRIQGGTSADLREIGGGGALATVRAPIAGIVAARAAAVGQYLGSGTSTPLFVVTNEASVWLVAQVAESDARRVRVGDRLDVTTPSSPGRVFSAAVDMVGAGLDPVTHRLPVRAVIANPDGALKPQMFAEFTIRAVGGAGASATALTVPAEAVIREGAAARVWVALPGRRLVARDVAIAEGPDDQSVTILSGLKPGERIVTRGSIFVNEAGIPG